MAVDIIGLDLDGTLLTDDKQITEYTRNTLIKAMARGAEVVPVTGRPLHGIPPVVLQMPGIRYAITSNGAATYELHTGKDLRPCPLQKDVVEQVLEAAEGFDMIRELFVGGFGYEEQRSMELLLKRARPVLHPYVHASRRIVPDLRKFLAETTEEIQEVSFMSPAPENRAVIEARLRKIPEILVVRPFPGDLEICAKDADKGEALLWLAKRLGSRRENVMAVGDGDNDRGLLERAGIAVAMGNAVQSVRDMAAFITEDNAHDGVAKAVERFAL